MYHADKTRALKKGLIKIVSGFTTEVNVFYLQTRQNDQEIFRDQNFDYLKLLSKNRVPNKVVLRALLFTDIPKGSWENKLIYPVNHPVSACQLVEERERNRRKLLLTG